MKDIVKIVILIFFVLFSIHVLNNKVFSYPPMGKLLNPFHGYSTVNNDNESIFLNDINANAEVIWDENNIPHIFAENEHDLYMIQGYIVAQDRLWQMDFITRVHAGKLSEIMGYNNNILRNDRFMRTIGIVEGAKASLSSIAYCLNLDDGSILNGWNGLTACPKGYNLIIKEPIIYDMMVAYSNGVNKYISSLAWNQLPIEYKILDYQPELWSPLKTCILLKTMSLDLTGRNSDVLYEFIRQEYGIDKATFLYPESPYKNEPIIPLEDFKELKNPNIPICYDGKKMDNKYNFTEAILTLSDMYNPGIGSNNWAIHKDYTQNKNAILANDPHLRLSLPNVWHVSQLSTPELDIMGATFPGAPGVLSGFNNYIAWGETNGEDDVSDFYIIEVDPNNSDNYIYDGESIPFDKREEKIFIRGSAFDFPQDTTIVIKSTKHGPIIIQSDKDDMSQYNRGLTSIYAETNMAFRWIAHDPTTEIKAFYDLNHAKNYDEFIEALAGFECPCQNFAYADISGNIAIYHKGKIPIRCASNAKGVLPGNESRYLWEYDNLNQFIPIEHLPLVKNPKRGYISSANQYPMPESYPYYLPGVYWPANRANRINNLLNDMTRDKNVNINDMKKVQNDSYNSFANEILFNLLESIKDKAYKEGYEDIIFSLKGWDMNHHPDMHEPIIFEKWYEHLNEAVWGDLFINKSSKKFSSRLYPLYDRLAQLINESKYWDSEWFDDSRTENIKEDFHIIAWNTFKSAIDELNKHEKFKDKNFTDWKYSDFRGTDISHIISAFKAFSRLDVPTSGSKWSPNAMQQKFGPSWRYIVELEKDSINAIAIYPGGQSGNPGSQFYDNYIDQWADGEYINLNFTSYSNKDNLKGRRSQFINVK